MEQTPWHAPGEDVYHTNAHCQQGLLAWLKRAEWGSAGKSKCQVCEQLEAPPRSAAARSGRSPTHLALAHPMS